MQPARITPRVQAFRWIAVINDVDVDSPLAYAQCGFERLEHTAAFGPGSAQAILDDLENYDFGRGGFFLLAATLFCRLRLCCNSHRSVRTGGGFEVACVALFFQQRAHFGFLEVAGHRHRKGQQQARIAGVLCALQDVCVDAFGIIASHRLAATPAEQGSRTSEQQLQVIVQLGHRADRGARRAHWVGLIDGDGRGNSGDRIDLRLVHPIQELPGVGREGFDVTALTFRIQRVEHERRFSGTRNPRYDDEFVQRNVETEVLQVVLARTAQNDGVMGGVGHSVTVGLKWRTYV